MLSSTCIIILNHNRICWMPQLVLTEGSQLALICFFRQLVRPGIRECDKERHVKTPFRFCLEIIIKAH